MNAAQAIKTAADKRDAISEARDRVAEQRDKDADLVEMMDADSDYGSHWPERRYAGLDRAHAKDDRAASRTDRIDLTRDGEKNDTERT
jgi:hypothetical protein